MSKVVKRSDTRYTKISVLFLLSLTINYTFGNDTGVSLMHHVQTRPNKWLVIAVEGDRFLCSKYCHNSCVLLLLLVHLSNAPLKWNNLNLLLSSRHIQYYLINMERVRDKP